MPHSLLIPDATRDRLAEYLVSLQSHDARAGGYLAESLAGHELAATTEAEFRHVDANAATRNTSALLTIPGLGCGQFAGPFRGHLGAALQTVLERLLTTHGASLPNIRAVYYDPQRSAYLPPPPFRTWEEVVKSKGLRLRP